MSFIPISGQAVNFVSPVHIPFELGTVILTIVPVAVVTFGFWDQYADFLQSQSLKAYNGEIEEFDFIIVGAGSAGSVVTNRLTTAKENYSVLLLEAGGNLNPMQNVPGYFPFIPHLQPVDYDYYTVPQINACLALNEHRSFWPRGKGLGGSSNLNAMLYQRGNPNNYDKWTELSGSEEWSFKNILRNFKNIEDYHGRNFNEKFHSNDGSGVYVSDSNEKRLVNEFINAGREMGYPEGDVNGYQQASFGTLDVTIKNGQRNGAYSAFLQSILTRKNLHIYRYAQVQQVKFNKNKRAYGLTYIRHGVKRFVRAKKEIILSAGAIDSPKILMLSGIGPRAHLEKLGTERSTVIRLDQRLLLGISIENQKTTLFCLANTSLLSSVNTLDATRAFVKIKPIVDLPVGKNLQDHVYTQVPFTMEASGVSVNLKRDFTIESITDYLKDHSGMLSVPLMSANGIAYVYSDTTRKKMIAKNISAAKTSPDIQLIFVPTTSTGASTLERFQNVKKRYLKSYFGEPTLNDGFAIFVVLGKPISRGEMKLSSSNPNYKPLLDPKYFSNPEDIKTLIEGVNFTVSMIENSKAFQKYGTRLFNKPVPGCEHYPFKSLEYYECFVRYLTFSLYHPCGTCSMGKGKDDSVAVVDHKLRVINTKGLRIVDASIIPEIPNSNLNAAVYMIGDKASEMILKEWEKYKKR